VFRGKARAAATAARPGYRSTGPRARAAVCLGIIDRLSARSPRPYLVTTNFFLAKVTGS